MADVSKININGISYNCKDSEARTGISTLNANKANKADVDNFKNETNNKLLTKYDSSNVETGSGTLTATQSGYEGSFNYTKVHNVVTICVDVKNISTDRKECYFYGLPFMVASGEQKTRIPVYTNKKNLLLVAPYNNEIIISKNTNFEDGENVYFTFSYFTN